MIPRHEIKKLKRAANRYNPAGAVGGLELVRPEGIVQFATEYLGCALYPRQGTLLKIMTLDTPNFTDFDRGVIDEWEQGFVLDTDGWEYRGSRGTTPDLMARIDWCHQNGLSYFRHNILIVGRRGSKNFLSSIMVCQKVWDLLLLGDPHVHYQMQAGKPIVIFVVGTNLETVKRNAFGDVANMLRSAPCFAPFLGASTTEMQSILTPADLEKGLRPDVDTGSIRVIALPTTVAAVRGSAVIGANLDEFAFVDGAGSTADSVAVFEALTPASAQFDKDALFLQTSTPWDKQGQLYISYSNAREVNPSDFLAANPDHLMIQLESTALYEDWDRAGRIAMWPDGPTYVKGLRPKVTTEFMAQQYRIDPVSAAVEFGSQFRSTEDPYLTEAARKGIFAPYKGELLSNQSHGQLQYWYVAHGDPSKSNANFAWAIAHIEEDENGYPHVVFDLLKVWKPTDFPNGVIDYMAVNVEIYGYLKAFMLRTITFDQYASVEKIQVLTSRARAEGLWWQPNIHERTSTEAHNLRANELFKTASNAGLIHAPHHPLAELELEFVRRQGDKVVAPTTGPVRTKDMVDAMANVTYTLLHDRYDDVFDALSGLRPSGSRPGEGIPPALPNPPPRNYDKAFSAAGRYVRNRQGRYWNPARGRSHWRR